MLRIASRFPARRGVAAVRAIATTPARQAEGPAPPAIGTRLSKIRKQASKAAAASEKHSHASSGNAITKEKGAARPQKSTVQIADEAELAISKAWSAKHRAVLQRRKDVLLALTDDDSRRIRATTPVRSRSVREIALGLNSRTRYDIHEPMPAARDRQPRILKGVRYNERQSVLELTFRLSHGTKSAQEEFTASTSALWVRDLCACHKCRTPASGQKEVMTHDLDVRPRITCITAYNSAGDVVAVAETPVADAHAHGAAVQAETTPIPDGQTVAKLVVAWDDGARRGSKAGGVHKSEFAPRDLLEKMAGLFGPQAQAMPQRQLWDRERIETLLTPVPYADWMARTRDDKDDKDGKTPAFYRALSDLHRLGLVVIDGVPDVETAVRDIAQEVGHVQPTFYGELFDVVSKPPTEAENVAYTSVHLGLHQDLLYLNDAPRIQLLHCLRNDCAGGESLFSDSLRAAVEMQLRYPYYAMALATHAVPYHYERNGHYYYNERPVFEVDHTIGATPADQSPTNRQFMLPQTYLPYNELLRHTAWSPPFQGIFQPMTYVDRPRTTNTRPDAIALWDADQDLALGAVDPRTMTQEEQGTDYRQRFSVGYRRSRLEYWHEAARVFDDLLNSERNLFEFKLKPGQCVLFDNRRVLHGRRQFTPVADATVRDYPRWLKGTYLSDQVFRSRVTDMVRTGNAPAGTVPPARGWTAEHALLDEQVQVLDILKSQGTPLWESVKVA